jgi:hypothetical protein
LEKLYLRTLYTSADIPYIFNKSIYEYDIKQAGFNISKELKLLPDQLLDEIYKTSKNKKEVSIKLGNIQRKDKLFKENLNNGFIYSRKLLFDNNGLEYDDIISIKKDAIITTKECNNRKFGYIEFVNKNTYTDYILLGKLELYYNKDNDKLDIKGIDDDVLLSHDNIIIDFFKKFINLCNYNDKERLLRYLRLFIDKYKNRELDIRYYREFNSGNLYYDNNGNSFDYIFNTDINDVDISYNYTNILTPLISLALSIRYDR